MDLETVLLIPINPTMGSAKTVVILSSSSEQLAFGSTLRVDSDDRVESYVGLFYFLDISQFPRHVNRQTCFAATSGNRVERLDLFLHRHSRATEQSLL